MNRDVMAIGGTIFAAWMMLVAGIWQVLAGIAAIAKDEFFVVMNDYAYAFDTTGWGWIHLVIGVIALFAGFSLFTGRDWARALGVGIAILSMISNFAWLPYQPWWSIVVIAIDVFIIWSLVNVGDRLRNPDEPVA